MFLTYNDLISESLYSHAKKIRSKDNDEIITFYIDKNDGWQSISRYYSNSNTWQINNNAINLITIAHSQNDISQIRSIFSRIDEIIDLDFEEMTHPNGSEIDIYSVDYSSSFTSGVVGQVITQETINGAWFDVIWKDSNGKQETTIFDINIIIHELGHALGLSHPQDDPFNTNWTTSDTVMSYNQGSSGWDTWFSELDIYALQSIWGRENDNGILSFKKESKEYTFKKVNNKNYSIKTTIGEEDITGITTLKFKDKELNLNNDIINVFDQITGVNDVSGKIFRLYNAAFHRFPDSSGLNYWITKNKSGENSYRQTCSSFIISNEFIHAYGNEITNEEYLNTLYSNVLNRSADLNGFNYWLGNLNNGIEDRSEVLMGFSESVENKALFMESTGLSI